MSDDIRTVPTTVCPLSVQDPPQPDRLDVIAAARLDERPDSLQISVAHPEIPAQLGEYEVLDVFDCLCSLRIGLAMIALNEAQSHQLVGPAPRIPDPKVFVRAP